MDALDLGFRVSKATSVASVHLFVPFAVDAGSISDLGGLLADAEIAIAIFNEDAKVTGSPQNQPSFSIRLGSAELSCWKLQPATDLRFEGLQSSNSKVGTVITFEPRVFAVDSDLTERYVRFRIILSSEADAAFFTRYDPPDRRLLSGFDEIEVVDFRFNEARNLPRNVIEKMTGGLQIREINYFVIRNITDDLIISHSDLKKCRTLESSVWTRYVQGDQTTPLRNAIIYYWQKLNGPTDSIKDYNALARFRRRKTDLRAIGWFVLSTLVIGIIAGLVSGAVVTYFAPKLTTSLSGIDWPTAQSKPLGTALQVPPIPTEEKSTSG
jgi:hypothetical protein